VHFRHWRTGRPHHQHRSELFSELCVIVWHNLPIRLIFQHFAKDPGCLFIRKLDDDDVETDLASSLLLFKPDEDRNDYWRRKIVGAF